MPRAPLVSYTTTMTTNPSIHDQLGDYFAAMNDPRLVCPKDHNPADFYVQMIAVRLFFGFSSFHCGLPPLTQRQETSATSITHPPTHNPNNNTS